MAALGGPAGGLGGDGRRGASRGGRAAGRRAPGTETLHASTTRTPSGRTSWVSEPPRSPAGWVCRRCETRLGPLPEPAAESGRRRRCSSPPPSDVEKCPLSARTSISTTTGSAKVPEQRITYVNLRFRPDLERSSARPVWGTFNEPAKPLVACRRRPLAAQTTAKRLGLTSRRTSPSWRDCKRYASAQECTSARREPAAYITLSTRLSITLSTKPSPVMATTSQ